MAALANEKGRQESELRQRRLRRRTSSPSDDVAMDSNNDGGNRSSGQATNDEGVDLDRKKKGSPERKTDGHGGHGEATSSKSASSQQLSHHQIFGLTFHNYLFQHSSLF